MIYGVEGLPNIEKDYEIQFSIIHAFKYKLSHSCVKAEMVECLGLNPDWNLDNNELSER